MLRLILQLEYKFHQLHKIKKHLLKQILKNNHQAHNNKNLDMEVDLVMEVALAMEEFQMVPIMM